MGIQSIALHFADELSRQRALTAAETEMLIAIVEKRRRDWSADELDRLRQMRAARKLAPQIAPTMPLEQVDAWIRVTSAALSNLPGRVAQEAAEQALYRPMKFVNEVETVIREEAADIQTRHRLALRRLRQLQDAIDNPRVALPEPEPMKWDEESVELANWTFAKVGATVRYRLVGDDVEHFEVEPEAEAA